MSKQIVQHIPGTPITPETEYIRVKGHYGTWYVVDAEVDDAGRLLFELKHETYGDEAAHLIVDESGSVVLSDV